MEIDETPAAKPKSRRRWHQFSLRTLLIAVTLVGCGLGWFGKKVWEAKQQAAAVAAIENAGGSVLYDYEIDSHGNYVPKVASPDPAWLRAILGDRCLRIVRWVSFDTFAGDPTTINDANLGHLKELMGLEYLTLSFTQVTDTGLKQLQGLTDLRSLDLTYTQVTDAGLESLRRLTRLKSLNLRGTKVTDAGVERLQELLQLRQLTLTNTQISDAGLEHLKGLTQLHELSLDYNYQVTDAGLEHLTTLTELTTLNLSGTQVTDAGLEHLNTLTQLKTLSLDNTHVTHAGVAKLQQTLPNCKIER